MNYNMPLATVIVWYVGMIDCHVCNCLLIRRYGANIEIISLRDKYFVVFFTIILIVKNVSRKKKQSACFPWWGSMHLL